MFLVVTQSVTCPLASGAMDGQRLGMVTGRVGPVVLVEKKARSLCLCGAGVCGEKSGRHCIFHHMASVVQQGQVGAPPTSGACEKRRNTIR